MYGVKMKQIYKSAYYSKYQITGKRLSEVLQRTAMLTEVFHGESMEIEHSMTKKNKHRITITFTF